MMLISADLRVNPGSVGRGASFETQPSAAPQDEAEYVAMKPISLPLLRKITFPLVPARGGNQEWHVRGLRANERESRSSAKGRTPFLAHGFIGLARPGRKRRELRPGQQAP